MLDVLVVGSANMDYIIEVDVPPAPGETVLARDMTRTPGGKGANQAVAAARMGAKVRLLASVGDDEDGAEILRRLRAEGIDTSAVDIVDHRRTGLALVSVFRSGENSITVVPGANHAVDADRIRRSIANDAAGPCLLVLQGELLPEATSAAARAVSRTHGRVILNLAPYSKLPPDVIALADPLVLNESEAGAMCGITVVDVASAMAALSVLIDRAGSAVITLGALGAVWAAGGDAGHVPAPVIDAVVDTTGAGDAFTGALAAELARGGDLASATAVGVGAGSFAVSRIGAQQSYPWRDQLLGSQG
jgi:ribokinase